MLVGAQGAEVVKAAIDSAREPGQGVLASVVAFVLLFVGATGVFAELQSALERLWTQGTGAAAVDAVVHTATMLRLRGIAYVLAFGFLMLVSTVISSLLGLLETWAGSQLDMKLLLALLNQAISFLITTALFVSLMRMSAGPQPRLRYLIRGAAVAALLFGVGKYGLALYLSTAAVVSAYGAAGSLVVLLMWIDFAAAAPLYGASLARVMAERVGDFAPGPTPPPAAAVTGLRGRGARARRRVDGAGRHRSRRGGPGGGGLTRCGGGGRVGKPRWCAAWAAHSHGRSVGAARQAGGWPGGADLASGCLLVEPRQGEAHRACSRIGRCHCPRPDRRTACARAAI